MKNSINILSIAFAGLCVEAGFEQVQYDPVLLSSYHWMVKKSIIAPNNTHHNSLQWIWLDWLHRDIQCWSWWLLHKYRYRVDENGAEPLYIFKWNILYTFQVSIYWVACAAQSCWRRGPLSISNCEFGGETFDGPITIDNMTTVGFDNATVSFTCTPTW